MSSKDDEAIRAEAASLQERLAAIVSSSDDVIISKTLQGIITSWNAGASRILGYDEAEMVGSSIMRIIPPELAHEETTIMRRIRSGERIEHFDTQRMRKDGTRVHLSRTEARLEAAGDNSKTTFPWTTSECTQYAWGLVIEGEASKRQITQATTVSIGTTTNMRRRLAEM